MSSCGGTFMLLNKQGFSSRTVVLGEAANESEKMDPRAEFQIEESQTSRIVISHGLDWAGEMRRHMSCDNNPLKHSRCHPGSGRTTARSAIGLESQS